MVTCWARHRPTAPIRCICPISHWRARARALKRQALTVWFAARDPALPWPQRVLALAVAAYAFSPIDLIPDFIPVLGLLDDLVLIPLAIALLIRLTPPEIVERARARAERAAQLPTSRMAAAAIVLLWVLLLGLGVWWWLR